MDIFYKQTNSITLISITQYDVFPHNIEMTDCCYVTSCIFSHFTYTDFEQLYPFMFIHRVTVT